MVLTASGMLLTVIRQYPADQPEGHVPSVPGLIGYIRTRLIDEDDMRIRREELELVRQKPYQGVREYALKFSECLNKAYTAEDLVGPITLPRLIQTFINGLESETLRWHTAQSRPIDINAAMATAIHAATTQRLIQRPSLRREEEPMDVSALPPPPLDMVQAAPPAPPPIDNLQEVISTIVSRQLSGLQRQVGKLARRLEESLQPPQPLIQPLMPRRNPPEILLTDQGVEFKGQDLAGYLRHVGTEHRRTTPYHPQTNRRIERAHRTLKSIIRKLINNRTTDWEDWLGAALWAHRITVSDTTQFSPYFLQYGREPRLPLSRLLCPPSSRSRRCISS